MVRRSFVIETFLVFSPSFSSSTSSLSHLLVLWERKHLTRGVLRSYTGDIGLDGYFCVPAASAAMARGRSSLTSRCTFSSWPSLSSSPSSSPSRIAGSPAVLEGPRVPGTPRTENPGRKPCHLVCPNLTRTSPAEEIGWRSSQLDCPTVGGSRQAEEPGSRGSHPHQVGEEFLNYEGTSEVPAVLPVERTGCTGGMRGRMQRSSSARLLRGRSRPPWSTKTPLATVPRGDGNVGRGCVGAGFSDGVPDHRSGLNATFFPSPPCFLFRCPFKQVVRRQSTLRCVQERGQSKFRRSCPREGVSSWYESSCGATTTSGVARGSAT